MLPRPRSTHMHLLLATITQQRAALADPATIRRTAEEVVQRPEFQLERSAGHGFSLLDILLRFLARVLGPIFRFFAAVWDVSPILAVLFIIVLTILLIALLWHIFYTFKTVLTDRARNANIDELQRAAPDPRAFEQQAAEAARSRDYITAIRLLFRASLLRLEQSESRKARPGLTNREWLRRYQHSAVHEALQRFVDLIDVKWYGGASCSAADYETCLQAHTLIRGASPGRPHAHGA